MVKPWGAHDVEFCNFFWFTFHKEDVPVLSNIKLLQHTSLDKSQTETREIYVHVVVYMRIDTNLCMRERVRAKRTTWMFDLPLWVCKTRRETLACIIFISNQPKDSLSVHWLFRKKNAHYVTANAQQIIKNNYVSWTGKGNFYAQYAIIPELVGFQPVRTRTMTASDQSKRNFNR